MAEIVGRCGPFCQHPGCWYAESKLKKIQREPHYYSSYLKRLKGRRKSSLDKQQDSHTTDGLPTLKVQTFSEDSIKLLPPIPAKVSQLPPPESAKSKKHSSMIKPKINYAEMSLEKDEESFDSSCNSRSDITYRPVLIWKPGNPRPLSPCQPPPQPQLNSGGFSPNMHDKVKEKDSTVREDRRTPLMVYRTDLTQTLPPHKGHHKADTDAGNLGKLTPTDIMGVSLLKEFELPPQVVKEILHHLRSESSMDVNENQQASLPTAQSPSCLPRPTSNLPYSSQPITYHVHKYLLWRSNYRQLAIRNFSTSKLSKGVQKIPRDLGSFSRRLSKDPRTVLGRNFPLRKDFDSNVLRLDATTREVDDEGDLYDSAPSARQLKTDLPFASGCTSHLHARKPSKQQQSSKTKQLHHRSPPHLPRIMLSKSNSIRVPHPDADAAAAMAVIGEEGEGGSRGEGREGEERGVAGGGPGLATCIMELDLDLAHQLSLVRGSGRIAKSSANFMKIPRGHYLTPRATIPPPSSAFSEETDDASSRSTSAASPRKQLQALNYWSLRDHHQQQQEQQQQQQKQQQKQRQQQQQELQQSAQSQRSLVSHSPDYMQVGAEFMRGQLILRDKEGRIIQQLSEFSSFEEDIVMSHLNSAEARPEVAVAGNTATEIKSGEVVMIVSPSAIEVGKSTIPFVTPSNEPSAPPTTSAEDSSAPPITSPSEPPAPPITSELSTLPTASPDGPSVKPTTSADKPSTPPTTSADEPSAQPTTSADDTSSVDEPSTLPTTSSADEPSTLPAASSADEPSTLPTTSSADEPSTLPTTSSADDTSTLPTTSSADEPSAPPTTSSADEPSALPTTSADELSALPTTSADEPSALPTTFSAEEPSAPPTTSADEPSSLEVPPEGSTSAV